MESPPPLNESPHISIFLHACTSSLAYSRDKKKNVLRNDPLTKELQCKDSRSPRSPLGPPAFRAADSCFSQIHQRGALPKL